MTPREQIAEILERAGKATKPPWVWWTSNSWKRLKRDAAGVTITVIEPYVCSDGHPDLTITNEDMEFIANARLDIPALAQIAEDALDKAWRHEREIEIRKQAMSRYGPCGDHGGKALPKDGCQMCRAEKAEAGAERLAAALEKIASGDGVYGAQAHEYKQIARAALQSGDI